MTKKNARPSQAESSATHSAIVPNTASTIKAAMIRFASWLALIFRGVA